MIKGYELIEKLYSENEEEIRLYSTGDPELDGLLEKAFCEGYEYAQKEFGRTGKSPGQAKIWFEGGNKKENKKKLRDGFLSAYKSAYPNASDRQIKLLVGDFRRNNNPNWAKQLTGENPGDNFKELGGISSLPKKLRKKYKKLSIDDKINLKGGIMTKDKAIELLSKNAGIE